MSGIIPAGRSAHDRLQGDIRGAMALVADKYMADQPPRPFVFRASRLDGFRRGADYRYELDMAARFPAMKDGQWAYAWAKLWCEQDAEWPFSASFFGPARLYVNGREAYRSNIEEEVFPDRRSWFSLKLAAGWNHFVLRFMKTGTGCGARFGTGSIKGRPLHFVWPAAERGEGEGWIYTPPLDEELAVVPGAGLSEADTGTVWLPRPEWAAGALKRSAFERLFGSEQGTVAYAWTCLRVDASSSRAAGTGAAVIEGWYWGGLTILLDGVELFRSGDRSGAPLPEPSAEEPALFSFTLVGDAAGGERQLLLRLQCGPTGWGVRFAELPDGVELIPPLRVEGCSEPWCYAGEFHPGEEPEAASLTDRHRLHDGAAGAVCWRLDRPATCIRPFVEATHYGRWNYPLGVTLYGLMAAGMALGREAYADYALNHIEQCTALDAYALWDAETFGAPGVNHQLALIDTLDDCGSFGATLLTALKRRELTGGRAAADRIARYIAGKQDRLPDGALYRVRGSAEFMRETMWCDDLYMSVPFLVRYCEMTGDNMYLDDAAAQFLLYKHYLFMPERSIMSHVFDFKFNRQNGVPWGRGNGWVLFSLAELLEAMPGAHERRPELLRFYRELCAGYLALQGERGLWHQVLDDPGSYEETSCTAMFVYAFAKGLRHGWLTEAGPYEEAVRRGWAGLAKYAIDEAGNVYGVCRGSGYSYSRLYYKDDLTWQLNDTHGIGIVLLAGAETLKL